MGATVSSGVGLAKGPPALPPAKQNNNLIQVSTQSPPDYKFEHFTKLCQHSQEEKKLLQVKIRMEVLAWRSKAQNGDDGSVHRDNILALLSKFKGAQQQQDALIEKEKLRLDAFRNCINDDTTNRIKNRLNFFSKLNKQHEVLLELVREDVRSCKEICKGNRDLHGRSRGIETWLKCPSPAYDYGSIGSL